MATLLYYFPNATRVEGVADLPTALRHVLADAHWERTVSSTSGPGGHSAGILMTVTPATDEGHAIDNRYVPDHQIWCECHHDDQSWWVGYWKQFPPRPVDLRREKMLDGGIVTLKGMEFVVPILHVPISSMRRFVTIPHKPMYTGHGWVPVNDERYAGLVAQSARWFDAANDPEASTFTYSQELDFVTDILSVNYRVGPWEISAGCLGLIDTGDVIPLIMTALGVRALADEQEASKKAGGWSATPAGI